MSVIVVSGMECLSSMNGIASYFDKTLVLKVCKRHFELHFAGTSVHLVAHPTAEKKETEFKIPTPDYSGTLHFTIDNLDPSKNSDISVAQFFETKKVSFFLSVFQCSTFLVPLFRCVKYLVHFLSHPLEFRFVHCGVFRFCLV